MTLEPLEGRQLFSTSSFALVPGQFKIDPISVATDTRGNVLVLGTFTGTVDFDPRPNKHYTVHSGDDFEPTFFIAKYSTSGIPLWVIPHATDAGRDTRGLDLQAIATDVNDNVYLSGTLNGNFDAAPSPRRVSRVYSYPNSTDALIWKLSPQGTLLNTLTHPAPLPFYQESTRSGFTRADRLAVDDAGGVYLEAEYSPPEGGAVAALVRFDSNDGYVPFDTRLPNLPGAGGSAIALDSQGNVGFAYVNNNSVIRLSRFTAKGKFVSDIQLANIPRDVHFDYTPADNPTLASLAIDKDQNAIICGTFNEFLTSDFDTGRRKLLLQPRTTFLNYDETYLAKYTPLGRPIFAEALNSDRDVRVAGAGIDRAGYIDVTGSFSGKADLNPNPDRVFFVQAAGGDGYQDLFSSVYDTNGKFVRAASTHVSALDSEAYFFGFAPSAPSPTAAVLAILGDYDNSAAYGYREFGIAIFAN
jgi:hypothetical protein